MFYYRVIKDEIVKFGWKFIDKYLIYFFVDDGKEGDILCIFICIRVELFYKVLKDVF